MNSLNILGWKIHCKNGLLPPVDIRPEESMQRELNAGPEPVGEYPFGQFPRFAGAVGRAEEHLFGGTGRAFFQKMHCPKVVMSALNYELDLVPGSEMIQVFEVHLIAHPAVRAFDIQYADGSVRKASNVPASVRLHQNAM